MTQGIFKNESITAFRAPFFSVTNKSLWALDILKEEGCRDFEQYAHTPGSLLMLDFFLDDPEGKFQSPVETKGETKKASSSGGAEGDIDSIFDRIKTNLNEEIVGKTKAVFAFNVKGFIIRPFSLYNTIYSMMGFLLHPLTININNASQWGFLCLQLDQSFLYRLFIRGLNVLNALFSGSKGGEWYLDLKNGSGAVGKGPSSNADVTFSLSDSDFLDVFEGRVSATSAFMSGKMKLKGDMGKALALDGLMKKML